MRILTLAITLVTLISGCAIQQPTETNRPLGTTYSPESSENQECAGTANQTPERNFFCLGDTKAVVEMVQGTPTSIMGSDGVAIWLYGEDLVSFNKGAVSNYQNYSGRLRVRVFPPSPIVGAAKEYPSPQSDRATNSTNVVGDGYITEQRKSGSSLELAQQSVSAPSTSSYIPQQVNPNPISIPRAPPTVYSSAARSLPTTSSYGEISKTTGLPRTIPVSGYFRKDGTYVRPHYRSRR
jgi:hypothetical protein